MYIPAWLFGVLVGLVGLIVAGMYAVIRRQENELRDRGRGAAQAPGPASTRSVMLERRPGEAEIESAVEVLAEEAARLNQAAIVVNVRGPSGWGRKAKFLFYESGSQEESLGAELLALHKDGGILAGVVGWRISGSGVQFERRAFPFHGEKPSQVDEYLDGMIGDLMWNYVRPALDGLRLRQRLTQEGFPFESEEEED